jgi:hypothetical protein
MTTVAPLLHRTVVIAAQAVQAKIYLEPKKAGVSTGT